MIEFDNTVDQGISFGTVSAVQNLGTLSVRFWIYQDTRPSSVPVVYLDNDTTSDENWIVWLNPSANAGYIEFQASWSSVSGVWRTGDVLAVGQWYPVAVTYDNSSTANDPVIYVSGSSVSVTEIAAPSGTYVTGTNNTLYIGANAAGVLSSPDG